MSGPIPAPMTYPQLASILADMADLVREGDSFEGWIQYTLPADPVGTGEVLVVGTYRTGNSMGQGGMRMIGTVPS